MTYTLHNSLKHDFQWGNSGLGIRSNTHSAPSLVGRYVRAEITQWHQGIRVLGASAKALIAPDGTVLYYRGLLIPDESGYIDHVSPVVDALKSIMSRANQPFFEEAFSVVPLGSSRLKIFEGHSVFGIAEPVFYPSGRILRQGWLIRSEIERPSFYLIDGDTSQIVGESLIEPARLYGSHFDKYCAAPYSNISCDNPFNQSPGDPGIPGSWACFGVDCTDSSDPNYAACCTPAVTPNNRVDSLYSGLDGDWTYVDPNDGTHRLSWGNNSFVARNSAPCGTGSCDNGYEACGEPELIMQCKAPLSDHNFTGTSGYTHHNDYSSDFMTPSLASESPAAIANVFFWSNWYHDFLYDLGFTETEKNFQFSNYGRGGLGDDGVVISVQYESLDCIFQSPFAGVPNYDDGDLGALFFCYDAATSDYDWHFGADILIHEYTHLVSSRLAGETCDGYSNADYPQFLAMAEGWSDYFALTNTNPVMAEVMANSWSKGVRTVRYDNSPKSFRDLLSGSNNQHANGEIWASALYDFRNMLMRKFYTIDESKAEQYGKYMADGTVVFPQKSGQFSYAATAAPERKRLSYSTGLR